MAHYLNNTNCFNTTNSVNLSGNLNISNHYTVPDQQLEILTWLSPLEPRVRHQDIQSLRADNVGDWLLKTIKFWRWSHGNLTLRADNVGDPLPRTGGFPSGCRDIQTPRAGSVEDRFLRTRGWAGLIEDINPALFYYGDPGVGKTYLSSLVIDRLGDMVKGKPDAVACFYFDFGARNEQTPVNMLGSLLKQIVGGLDRIPEDIVQAFEDQKKVIGGRRPRVPEIVKMLQTVTYSRRTFICVDALDECAEKHRAQILDSLREILEKSGGAQAFITGRRHICSEIERHLPGKASMVPIKLNNDDIEGYIRMRLSKDVSRAAMDSNLEAEITKSLAENIPESFLLVSITLDSILRETTIHGRRKKIAAMVGGSGVTDAYGSTLERIKEQGGERARLGIAALMWISHSERPLQLDELLHALTVEIESAEPNPENIPSLQTLLSCCLGLVTFDTAASRVRLIHLTLQEYLFTRSDLYANAHSKMAETCLTYLNFQGVRDLSPTLKAAPQSAPFLEYCSLYWGVHAKRGTSSRVISLALDLFSQFENHLSTKLLVRDSLQKFAWWLGTPMNGHLVGFTGLHCASLFGIFEIATALTDIKGCEPNKRDFLGLTPLMWASIFGQERVVKLLLEHKGVHPNKADKYHGRTAFSWAAIKGHEGVIRLFLDRAPRGPDGIGGLWGITPRVANLFFGERYINPNTVDKYRYTPLLMAANRGHWGVVRLLLGRGDVNPNAVDKYGATPLSMAANVGHVGVVKLLLRRDDTNPNTPDRSGQTPLWRAVRNNCEGVVKLLLDRDDVNPYIPDKEGKTPLSIAVSEAHDAVVKLLLERKDADSGSSREFLPRRSGTHVYSILFFSFLVSSILLFFPSPFWRFLS